MGAGGDVNGDGYADLVMMGAPGTAKLFYGNGGAGVALRPRQLTSEDDPIARLGATDSLSFKVAALGRSPFGRTKVRLEWEVKALGDLLDGTGTSVSSSASDTGTSGVSLDGSYTVTEEVYHHHWRVRLRYEKAASPFAQSSRWLTQPWDGSQEKDLIVP